MAKVDQNRHTLEVAFDKPVDGRPFAALRSMYVTDFNNDVARIAVREKGAKGWREDAIMAFERATATDIWAGRIAPSRHNTSLARHGAQRVLRRQSRHCAAEAIGKVDAAGFRRACAPWPDAERRPGRAGRRRRCRPPTG